MTSYNIFIYSSIIIISILSGSMLSRFIFRKFYIALNRNLFKIKSIKAIVVRSIFPIIIFLLLFVFIKLTEKTDNDKSKKVDKLIQEINLKVQENQLLKEYQTKQGILQLLQKYYLAYYSKNISSIDTFYVFPLEKFFTYKNVSVEKTNERIKFYWNHHSDSLFHVNSQNTEINFKTKDLIQISIIMFQNENKTIFTKIKMNGARKIFSVGNSILTNYYPEESLNDQPTTKKKHQ